MSELKNEDYNSFLMEIAEAAQKAKDFGNKARIPESVPLVGGMGAGDLLLGKTPDEVKEWAYGNSPVEVKPEERLPSLKHGRKQQVVDTAFTFPMVGGLVKSAASLARGGAHALGEALKPKPFDPAKRRLLTIGTKEPKPVISPSPEPVMTTESGSPETGGMTRREFLKDAAIAGGAVAAAPLLKHLPESVGEHAAERVVPVAERAIEDTLIHTAEETGANLAEKAGFRGLLGKVMRSHVFDNFDQMSQTLDDAPTRYLTEATHYDPTEAFERHMEESLESLERDFTPKQQRILESAFNKLDKYPDDVKSSTFHYGFQELNDYPFFTKFSLKDLDPEWASSIQDYVRLHKGSSFDEIIKGLTRSEIIDDPSEIAQAMHLIDPKLPMLTQEEAKVYQKFMDKTWSKVNDFFEE